MKKRQIDYPLIKFYGLTITDKPVPHIKIKHLNKTLRKHGIDQLFHKYFGIQTCLIDENGERGLYPCDCESVLHRIKYPKKDLIGTQKFWD